RRQARRHRGGQRDVVEACDSNVLGRAKASLLERLERANRGVVVGGEDCRRPGWLLQELLHRVITVDLRRVTGCRTRARRADNEVVSEGGASFRQRVQITLEAADARDVRQLRAEKRNPSMADAEEVLRGEYAAATEVRGDRIHPRVIH